MGKITIIQKEKIIHMYFDGNKPKYIAEVLNVALPSIYKIIRTFKTNGAISNRKRGGDRRSLLLDGEVEYIRNLVDSDPALTLKAISNKVDEVYNKRVSESTINRTLKKLHYSLKALIPIPAARNTPSTIEKRAVYENRFTSLVYENPASNFIFIDEVGFSITMRTKKGRSLVGTSAMVPVQMVRSKNFSIIAAANTNGMIYYKNNVRSVNGLDFIQFITELHSVCAASGIVNPIFILDNARIHHFRGFLELTNQLNLQVLYLPPYSPFLNIIENVFSKWKNVVRRGNAQNVRDLLNLIQTGFIEITGEDCLGFYRKMLNYLPKCRNREIINE